MTAANKHTQMTIPVPPLLAHRCIGYRNINSLYRFIINILGCSTYLRDVDVYFYLLKGYLFVFHDTDTFYLPPLLTLVVSVIKNNRNHLQDE
jgi:hypothetical protein